MPIIQRLWISRLHPVSGEDCADQLRARLLETCPGRDTRGVTLLCGPVVMGFSESPENDAETPRTTPSGLDPIWLSERLADDCITSTWSLGVLEPTDATDSDPDETNSSLAAIWHALPRDASPDDLAGALHRTAEALRCRAA